MQNKYEAPNGSGERKPTANVSRNDVHSHDQIMAVTSHQGRPRAGAVLLFHIIKIFQVQVSSHP